MEKLGRIHPNDSKAVLKTLLKTYLYLQDSSKRKGADPLLVLQDLVERIGKGQLYQTSQDKINHMDSLLEGQQPAAQSAPDEALLKEIKEMKSYLREIKAMRMPAAASRTMGNMTPSGTADLLTVEKGVTQKKRKNYRDLRKGSTNRKITF